MKSNIQNFIKASGVTVVRDAKVRPPPVRTTPPKTKAMNTNTRRLSFSPPRARAVRAMSLSPMRSRAPMVVFKTPQKNERAPVTTPTRPTPVTGKLSMTPFEYKLVNMSSRQEGANLKLRSALVKKPKLTFEPIVHGRRRYRVRMQTTYAMRGVKTLAKHEAGISKIAGNASESDITNIRFRVELVDEKSKTYTVDVYAYTTGSVRITAAVPKDDVGVLSKVRDWVIYNYLPRRKVLLSRLELRSVNAQWRHNGTFNPTVALRYLHNTRKNALSYEPEMKQYFIQFKIREHTVQLYPGGSVTLTGSKSLEAVKRGYAAANVVLYQMFRDGIIRTSNTPFASSPKPPKRKTVVNAPTLSWVGSTLHVGSRQCTSKHVKKAELVAVAKSLGIMYEKMKKEDLCKAIQRAYPKNGSRSPSRNSRVPARPDLTATGVRNDLIAMFGKTWMQSFGKRARRDLPTDVKNVMKALSLLKGDHLNVYGQPKKTIADALKKYLVNILKDVRRERYTQETLYESIVG
jgi:hypothetical protein